MKNHVVITTEKLLKDFEDALKATQKRKKKKIKKEVKKASEPPKNESAHSPISPEQIIFYSNENI